MIVQTKPLVAIVLLNYRNARDTITCVGSLLNNAGDSVLIIICDNDSRDGSFELLQESFCGNDNVVVIQTGKNNGFAYGNNVGIKYALTLPEVKFLWILNNDTEVESECIVRQVKKINNNPDIGILGVTLVYHDNPDVIQACGGSVMSKWTMISRHVGCGLLIDNIPDEEHVEATMSFVSGASMFTTRKFIEETGLLSENYFLYYEEADWVARMDRNKYRLGYCKEVIVRHKEGATIGSGSSQRRASAFSVFHICRSRLAFAWRYHKPAFPLVIIRMLRYAMASFVKRDRQTAKAIMKAMTGQSFV